MARQWWDRCRQSRTPSSRWSSSSTSWSPSSTSSTASAGSSRPSWRRSRRRSLQNRSVDIFFAKQVGGYFFAKSDNNLLFLQTRRLARPDQWVPPRPPTALTGRWRIWRRDRGRASLLGETLFRVRRCLKNEDGALGEAAMLHVLMAPSISGSVKMICPCDG